MGIPETQLSTWSHQGPITSSASTYESIKNCINKVNWNSDVNYEVYLQGSYKNSTNIYGNSDVDIVVQFDSIYSYSTAGLNPTEKGYFDRDFQPAKYSLSDFKKSIENQLVKCFGAGAVHVNNKAILVDGNGSRLNADVVVCNPYYKYQAYYENGNSRYVEGIRFFTENTFEEIINYPKPHYENGVSKNQSTKTHGNFKAVVRIFKNIKAKMIGQGVIRSKDVPSYYLECLLYNALNQHFRQSSYSAIVLSVINQFYFDAQSGALSNYVIQNEQGSLFGATDQQWNIEDAKVFINELVSFWNNQ